DSGVCVSCLIGSGDAPCVNPTHYAPAVWLNKFALGGQSGGWVFDSSYSGIFVQFTGNTPILIGQTMVGDFDGDGLADLVLVDPFVNTTTVSLNRHGKGGPIWLSQQFTSLPSFSSQPPYQVEDINRDGLADLVHVDYASINGVAGSAETILVNTGPNANGTGIGFSLQTRGNISGGTPIDVTQKPPRFADLDGDGFYDFVDYGARTSSPFVFAAAGLGDGTGYGLGFDQNVDSYVNTLLVEFTPPEATQIAFNFDDGYALQDINGDGLADLIRDHAQSIGNQPPILGGGEILLNTGRTWLAVDGRSSYVDFDAGPQRIPAVV